MGRARRSQLGVLVILDNESHRQHLLDCLTNVSVPGALTELHSEIKAAIRNAQVAVPPPEPPETPTP